MSANVSGIAITICGGRWPPCMRSSSVIAAIPRIRIVWMPPHPFRASALAADTFAMVRRRQTHDSGGQIGHVIRLLAVE